MHSSSTTASRIVSTETGCESFVKRHKTLLQLLLICTESNFQLGGVVVAIPRIDFGDRPICITTRSICEYSSDGI